ncbi:DUF6049 family protein [Rudaeicoccus suwonensis]|uniref:Uncharacterized protein n=1 Tax=Rudaeicoccus suwonensis TaxID=657409 RepID=A0A561E3Y3_9MICO|nr:DUF6049 family protein [Rudaeicoccus suwonensis]TWE10327.1 hypothetical protein BKA23_2683 [Rudaeicoccus suwonensis]
MNVASPRPPGSTSPAPADPAHRHRHRHRTARYAAAIFVCALFAFVTAWSGMAQAASLHTVAASAAAASPSTSVTISLSPTSPILTSDKKAVTVSGTITNTGSATITAPVVHIALGSRLLDTMTSVRNWASGSLDIPVQDVATATVPQLPGDSTSAFDATIPADKLDLGYSLASLPLTITVTDGSGQSASAIRGSVRTTLSIAGGRVSSPLKLDIVIPLTLPADPALFGPTGTARTTAWINAIGPDSALQQTLTEFQGLPVTWVVDPEILDPPAAADNNLPTPAVTTGSASASASSGQESSASSSSSSSSPSASSPVPTPTSTADGSSNLTSGNAASSSAGASGNPSSSSSSASGSSSSSETPTPAPTTPAEQLAAVVANATSRFAELTHGQNVWWLPYDDPDLTALSATGGSGSALINRDLSVALPAQLSAISARRALWPVGDMSASQLSRIAVTWTRTSTSAPVEVLPTRAVATPQQSQISGAYRLAGTSGLLTYDETLSRTFSAGGGDEGLRTQLLLAQLMATYQTSPESARSVTLVVPRTGGMPSSALAAEVAALERASWVSVRDDTETTTALAAAPTTSLLGKPTAGTAFPPVTATSVNGTTLHQLGTAADQLSSLSSILVDAQDEVSDRARALDVVGSTRWRGQASALSTTQKTADAAMTALVGQVTVNPSDINFFTDSGQITVTVANGLNVPVHDLTLTLLPRRYQLLISHNSKTIEIEANSRTSTRFGLKAVGAGTVRVDATLTGPQGQDLGPAVPAQLRINVQPTSSWMIIGGLAVIAIAVLIFGLRKALRRGPRTPTPLGAGDEATPEDAIVDTGLTTRHRPTTTDHIEGDHSDE